MSDDEPTLFDVDRRPPRPTPWRLAAAEPCRQKPLFAGLDCLAGQQDLFSTDGPPGEEP